MSPTTLRQAAPRIVDLLRGWGRRVEVMPYAYTWNPNKRETYIQCGVEHWTAGNTPTDYIKIGRKGLPLLANWHLLRDGTLRLVSVAYANHSGQVTSANLTALLGDRAPMDRDMIPGVDSKSVSANRYVGLEANAWPGAPFTPEQHQSATALWAAIAKVGEWGSPRVAGHKELTSRKPGDPSHPMWQRRRDVATYLATPTQQKEDPFMALTDTQQARLVEAADRIMGMMVQRFDADGNPARVLDSLDGGYLRDLSTAQAEKLGVDLAHVGSATAAVRVALEQQTQAVQAALDAGGSDPAAIRVAVQKALQDARLTINPEETA